MNQLKIEIKWAVIFTVVALLWMLLEKLTGLHDTHINLHLYLTNLFAIPAIIVMIKALIDKKNNFYNGKMSYKQGLISGVVLSIFIALLSPLAQWVTTYVITPEYFFNVIEYSVETGYYKTVSEAEAFFNYKNYAIQGAFFSLVMGIVTTTIAMIFIKTKPNH